MEFFNSKGYFTTGVLTRDKLTNFVRIAWLNIGKNTEFFKYRIYDWSEEIPVIIKEELVQLNPSEFKISDIQILSSDYGDSLNVKFYEVRLKLRRDKNTIVNIFGISNDGIISEGNTVLYSQLNPISYKS